MIFRWLAWLQIWLSKIIILLFTIRCTYKYCISISSTKKFCNWSGTSYFAGDCAQWVINCNDRSVVKMGSRCREIILTQYYLLWNDVWHHVDKYCRGYYCKHVRLANNVLLSGSFNFDLVCVMSRVFSNKYRHQSTLQRYL